MESHAAGLNGSFHDDDELELFLTQVISGHIIERRFLVNDVDDLQRPDKEDAGFRGGVWGDLETCHLLGHLTLRCRVPSQYLGGYLRYQN